MSGHLNSYWLEFLALVAQSMLHSDFKLFHWGREKSPMDKKVLSPLAIGSRIFVLLEENPQFSYGVKYNNNMAMWLLILHLEKQFQRW